MRFRGLDLNLLSAFHVLMEERNVTEAARQLNLSQPATSAALSRLRHYFGDEILLMRGKRMYPTTYAEALWPQVRECLLMIETVLATTSKFDPANTKRTFRVIASDYIVATIMTPLVERLSVQAPNIHLELVSRVEDGSAQLTEGKADLHIVPDFYMVGDHPSEPLLDERHVVAGWNKNPLFRGDISEKQLLEAGHVGIRIGPERSLSFADMQMNKMGRLRRIEVETNSFLAIPLFLCGTDRLALMQERLAQRLGQYYPLAWRPLPFEFPMMREIIQFHTAREEDPALKWLRGLLQEIAASSPASVMKA